MRRAIRLSRTHGVNVCARSITLKFLAILVGLSVIQGRLVVAQSAGEDVSTPDVDGQGNGQGSPESDKESMSRASDDLAASNLFARNFPGPDSHQLVTAKAGVITPSGATPTMAIRVARVVEPVRLRYTTQLADKGLRDFLLCRESGRTRSAVIGGSLLPMGLVLIGE